jgi:hypothetical protein
MIINITGEVLDNMLCTIRGRQVAQDDTIDHKWTLKVLVCSEMRLNNINITSQITLESHSCGKLMEVRLRHETYFILLQKCFSYRMKGGK